MKSIFGLNLGSTLMRVTLTKLQDSQALSLKQDPTYLILEIHSLKHFKCLTAYTTYSRYFNLFIIHIDQNDSFLDEGVWQLRCH